MGLAPGRERVFFPVPETVFLILLMLADPVIASVAHAVETTLLLTARGAKRKSENIFGLPRIAGEWGGSPSDL